ncbi:SWIM zinc finger family protein [Kocuria marina]|uniref:SWIM zinc finger family protein n=1 Tax=Kocuria marina TaxID=223184 RepID=UPI0022E7A8F7|nr:SWIM zinc finger family protein [Kocuria marina]
MAFQPTTADTRPRWSDVLGGDLILAAVAQETSRRGASYARSGRVYWVSSDPGRRIALASGVDTAAYPYQSLVQDGDARGTRSSSRRCSCPMGMNCKHVAALLVAALEDLATAGLAATAPPSRPC